MNISDVQIDAILVPDSMINDRDRAIKCGVKVVSITENGVELQRLNTIHEDPKFFLRKDVFERSHWAIV